MDPTVSKKRNEKPETIRWLQSVLDLTSLNPLDNIFSMEEMLFKVKHQRQVFPESTPPAAVCLYPSFVSFMKTQLEGMETAVAVVAGAFPHAHSFEDIRFREIEMAVNKGANEVDVVLNPGLVRSFQWAAVEKELRNYRTAAGEARLKVILETSLLQEEELIYHAAELSLQQDVDFLKTSSGKEGSTASPQHFAILCKAISDFREKTGKMKGIKAAGGIRSLEDATRYVSLLRKHLGEKWLSPSLFRIGSSSLANRLLEQSDPDRKSRLPYY